jgi:molecular chaperone GrpE
MTGTTQGNPCNNGIATPVNNKEDMETAGGKSETISNSITIAAELDANLAKQLEETRGELSKLKDDYLRALAETENVRRRAAREREDASRYAIAGFAADLLSVSDNLRRALESIDPQARGNDPALESLINGVEMTERELNTVFERYGIRRMDAIGQPFDPHVHEAMFELANTDVPNGTVLTVLQPGYMIADRILRPARVGVSKGGPKGKPASEPEDVQPAPHNSEDQGPSTAHASTEAYEKRVERNASSAGARVDESL